MTVYRGSGTISVVLKYEHETADFVTALIEGGFAVKTLCK